MHNEANKMIPLRISFGLRLYVVSLPATYTLYQKSPLMSHDSFVSATMLLLWHMHMAVVHGVCEELES